MADEKRIMWRILRTADGYAGEIIVPAHADAKHPQTAAPVQRVKLTGPAGPTAAHAMVNATSFASSALKNPVLQALIPPQAQAALKALSLVTNNPVARMVARKVPGGRFLSALAKRLA